jgi:histidyl-tRNA synthetase
MSKPSIPEGTRDFGPDQVRRRQYMFDIIRGVFSRFGFQPLETPAVENLSTLTGKYGDEGDKLLFKVLNNGDYLKDADAEALEQRDSAKLTKTIAKRGLRYDLTVPFARYVVMNRGTLTFPFKRYQIQPVWRADRPQRGRYREFFQCDVDVIGSDSLLFEAELVQIYDLAFAELGVPVVIKINNRKVLYGVAEAAGITDRFVDMTVAVDKLDKIGIEGVRKELTERGINEAAIAKIETILNCKDRSELRAAFADSPTGLLGLDELDFVFGLVERIELKNALQFDITLARGLSYYTGCIFEVAAQGIQMGSIGGGGRYADLTGAFGVPGLSGVGVSFGADRIYDVMNEMNLFPDSLNSSVQLLFACMDEAAQGFAFSCAAQLRQAGITTEIYPEPGKLKKQFEYVAKRNIPYVAIVGESEVESGRLAVKNQATGEQQSLTVEELINVIMR